MTTLNDFYKNDLSHTTYNNHLGCSTIRQPNPNLTYNKIEAYSNDNSFYRHKEEVPNFYKNEERINSRKNNLNNISRNDDRLKLSKHQNFVGNSNPTYIPPDFTKKIYEFYQKNWMISNIKIKIIKAKLKINSLSYPNFCMISKINLYQP